jgi:hypothetical protein
MPILTTDLLWRLSGGSGNADPLLSLGGAMSTTTTIADASQNNLFRDVTGPESSAGATGYRCIYLLNNHGSLTYLGAKVWLSSLTLSGDDEVDIGLGTTAVGTGSEQTIANETTPPTGVTFSRPVTTGTALVIGDIPAGSRKAIWIRRTVTAGAAAYTANQFTISATGETLS